MTPTPSGDIERDPVAAWKRFQNDSGPLHDLTVTVARTIHEHSSPGKQWDRDCEHDKWLAVGSWQLAEAVVAILPMAVVV